MGGRSRIFVIAAILLVLVNAGLAVAVVQQRDQAALARDEASLNHQLLQLTERLTLAKAVEASLPDLKLRLANLQSQYRAIEPRLYKAVDRSVVEMSLSRMATSPRGRGPGMKVDRITTKITNEQPPIKEHTFAVYMMGKVTLLPAFSEQFYDDAMLSHISRFAAVSPDMRFQDLEMVVRAHYYEVDMDAVKMPTEKAVLAPFTDLIDPGPTAMQDARLTAKRSEIQEARNALEALHPALIEAANLETRIKLHKQVLEQVNKLVAERQNYRALATENLPKLYLRVRNSPLGGAAMNLNGPTVTFPDFAGEE